MISLIQQNARDLEEELAWFAQVLDTRFKRYFGEEAAFAEVFEITPPDLSASESSYARFIRHYECSFAERLALILSLTPFIRPQLLDVFFTKNETFDRKYTEFGGVWGRVDGDFWPTGETLAFLLGANDLEIRFSLQGLFEGDHYFAKHNILHGAARCAVRNGRLDVIRSGDVRVLMKD